MSSSTSKPYHGPVRKLVLAFDIGTTYSGVSYSILDPCEVPRIFGVSVYPGQEHVGGNSKIPSILYYDRNGSVKAVGSEAVQQSIIDMAEEEDWVKVEWWMLHLRPKHLLSHIKDDDIPPLPRGKSAVEILGDFMQYLFSCTRKYIIETHASGAAMWKSMENDIEFIFTHPNGWDGRQQRQICHAAKLARLADRGRIHLLTEREANLHFCLDEMLTSDSLSNLFIDNDDSELGEAENGSEHQGVIVIHAGRGTVDLSAYSVKLSKSVPKEVREIATAEYLLQGSVFVTQRAHAFLKAKLANSAFGSPEIVEQMKESFDQTTRLRFRDASGSQYIKFGTVRDRDVQHDIRSGQLKLAGEDVAKFFAPSVDAVADAFQKQQQAAVKLQIQIKHAFLVGSFATSDFLYHSLQLHPALSGVHLYRPSAVHTNKVVADGAVSSYITRLVPLRASNCDNCVP